MISAQKFVQVVRDVVGDEPFVGLHIPDIGDREKARAAYAQALVELEVGSPLRNVVELKLSEVGGSPAQTEAGS